MAVIDAESFGASTSISDFTSYGLIASQSNTLIKTGGPLGDNYASLNPNSTTTDAMLWMRPLPSTYTTFLCGTRMLVNSANAARQETYMAFCGSDGQPQLTLTLNGLTGVVTAWSGGFFGTEQFSSATQVSLGSSMPASFPSNAWFYLEVGATMASGTSGSVTVKVNEVTVLTLTGINTNSAYNTNSQPIAIVMFNQTANDVVNGQMGPLNVAHYYFADTTGSAPWNTFLGDVRVQTLLPTGAGSSTAFTPTGESANWQVAALTPPTPLSIYNSSSTVGATDLFAMTAMDSQETNIIGVQVKALVYKTEAGARTVATVIKSGSQTLQGTALSPNLTPQFIRSIYQTDPNTNAQWTQSAVNAAQAGYTIVT